MVLLKRGQNDTATTLGQKLASSWTEFVKACPKFNKDIPYVFRNATENAGPLNKFIMNKDVVVILKRLFEGYTRDELLEDTEWMEAFFGSEEASHSVLNGMADDQWDNI